MDELMTYNYQLPEELVAQSPVTPRDSARLLIYNRRTGKTSEDTFRTINAYLPPNSLIVLNETKVLPARLPATKESGGKVDLLFLSHTDTQVTVLANKKLSAGSILSVGNSFTFAVTGKEGMTYILEMLFPAEEMMKVLETYGFTPIPPYIKHSPLTEGDLRREYQTVFAKEAGSAAAPTASLHFTKHLLRDLESAGHQLVYITLHVGLGTFAKVTETQLTSGTLHTEHYSISKKAAGAITEAKRTGRPIVAVGTTVVRALESAARKGVVQAGYGQTNLFIKPGFQFQVVDHLITNFHVPRSSLLMLVAALTGQEKLRSLYQQAIADKFRFFSFGDAMLIL